MYQKNGRFKHLAVVRNPITGEEVDYSKASSNGTWTDKSSSFIEPLPAQQPIAPSTSSLLSKEANASSIPLLNFADLFSEDRRMSNNDDNNNNNDDDNDSHKFRQKLNEFVMSKQQQNKELSFLEKSVAPSYLQTTYGHQIAAAGQLKESPIITYRNQLLTQIPSKLDAPRHDKFELAQKEFSDQLVPVGPASQKKQSIYKIERVADLEKLWLSAHPYTNTTKATSSNDNDHKEKLVMETVVTDQLSRFVLSQPETTQQQQKQQQQQQQRTIYTARGNRFKFTTTDCQHEQSLLNENQLARNKLKFNCRVRTPNGRLALRELFGIVFVHDGSLTVYEYRLMCGGGASYAVATIKKPNALPFLPRRPYRHAYGRRKNEPVTVYDIYRGNVIYLESMAAATSSGLPNEAKQMDYIQIEITEVDELEKENLLASNEIQMRAGQINQNMMKVRERLKQPRSESELTDYKIISSVRKFMRKQIESRSVEVYMGLSRSLKQKTRNHSVATIDQFHEALVEFNVCIHSADVEIVWQSLDLDSTGQVPIYDLLRYFLGEMSTERHGHFRTLMRKLDPHRCGYVRVTDVLKYYRAGRHPKVSRGELNEDQMFAAFLRSFDLLDPKLVEQQLDYVHMIDPKSKLIAYEQWEEFYNGLSIVIESDTDFINILKNSWNQF